MNSSALKLTLQNKIKPYSKCIQNLSQQHMRTILRSNVVFNIRLGIKYLLLFFRLYIVCRKPKFFQRSSRFRDVTNERCSRQLL